jgi:ABC-type sugar transport system ATPase subunit
VAQFIGSPPMNLLDIDATGLRGILAAPAAAVQVGIRPHDVRLDEHPPLIRGHVHLVEPLGASQILHIGIGESRVLALVPADARWERGAAITAGAAPTALTYFDRVGRAIH